MVAEVIAAHCEFRGWRLLACNVRTNHVHVVVGKCGTVTPEAVMGQFKAWATRRLREAGFVAGDAKVWTEHGSTLWINDEDSLGRAIEYVVNEQ
ncbi:MAG: transposase [Phycisphaerales bacterium]